MDNIRNTLIISIIFLIIILIISLINQNYKNNLKYILSNIILVYKNFIHWNVSKILFWVYTIFLSFFLSLPFIVLIVFLLYKVADLLKTDRLSSYFLSGAIDDNIKNTVLQNIYIFIFIIICALVVLIVFMSIYMYSNLLQQRLIKEYLQGNKIAFLKNKFFDIKGFWNYFKLTALITFFLLIPVLIGVVYMLIVAVLSLNFEAINNIFAKENIWMGIFQLSILITLIVWFVRLAIKLSFAYIVFLYNEKNVNHPLFYFRKSLEITKGKLLKIISLGLPFFFISIIIESLTKLLRQYYTGFGIYIFSEILLFFAFSGINFAIFIGIFHIITNKSFLLENEKSPELQENISEDLQNI